MERKYIHQADPEQGLAQLFAEQGLHLLGICSAQRDESDIVAENNYRNWLAQGNSANMDYLKRHAELKYHPQALLKQCQVILFAGLHYHQKTPQKPEDASYGRVALYAYGRDYHKVFSQKLKKVQTQLEKKYPRDSFRSFVDTSPLDERHYAAKANLGFIGKNTLLISKHYGSYFFLGEILSTHNFPLTQRQGIQECPISCQRCLRHCPNGAITNEYQIDSRRCIAYWTIEHKGSIPLDVRSQLGEWIFGCDECQSSCPLNLGLEEKYDVAFGPQRHAFLKLEDILALRTHEDFLKRFAGTALMRAGREALVRNACLAAAHYKDSQLCDSLERCLREDQSTIVTEHALWALENINA